jgi:hypothetical protein
MRLHLWVTLCGFLFLCIPNLLADNCYANYTGGLPIPVPIDGVIVCWSPTPTNVWNPANPPATQPPCPNNASVQCGFFYTLTGANGWTSMNGYQGWHNFTPSTSTSVSTWLNTASNFGSSYIGWTFNVSGNADIHNNDGTALHPWRPWRNPTGDHGWFLSSPDTSSITMTFPSGYSIKNFSFEWGSVDPWNTVTFTRTDHTTTTFYGCDLALPGFLKSPFSFAYPSGVDMNSILVNFQVPDGTAAWTAIKFSNSATGGGSCAGSSFPTSSFEFDNLEWKQNATAMLGGPAAPVATPEPSSVLLLGTGIAGFAGMVRRKLRTQRAMRSASDLQGHIKI